LSAWGLSWGAGSERTQELFLAAAQEGGEGMFGFAARTLRMWNDLVSLFAVSYAASFFWSAMTAIYLLLRHDEDGAEMEEVFLEGEGEIYGLPPLQNDAQGVPAAADLPPRKME
jgi:hypothetical protein